MKNILLVEPTIRPIGVNYLRRYFNIFFSQDGSEKVLIEKINDNDIDAIITRTEIINKKIIESCPSLKVIGQHGVGVNNIDIEAANKAGIYVVNVPDATFDSVAEHTLMSILALSRNLVTNDSEVRKGNWQIREKVYPSEISKKNLLIIGYGKIGKKVHKLSKAFNMNVLVYDPYIKKDRDFILVNDLIEGIREADYITLHLPLLSSTKNLIAKHELGEMKKNAYIINASRGGIINQKDLVNALLNREIGGAALDVLEEEPPDVKELILQMKNVILTPHIAGDTLEAKNRCSETLAREVIKVLHYEESKNVINKNELKKL